MLFVHNKMIRYFYFKMIIMIILVIVCHPTKILHNYWLYFPLQMVTIVMRLKEVCSWKKSYDKPRQHIEKKRHYFADECPYNQRYGSSSRHVWMWELDHKEGWALKNWCFQILMLEKILESPLHSKEIKPINPKENQPWILIGRTDAEAAAPTLWPLMQKATSLEKTLMLGKTESRRRGQQRMRWLDSTTD